ncbi:MAG: hypothetical protein LBB11_03585 [Puniceicoccales bacterium]|jgi:hypothetical protein|nr:hypothetical protein [Puniceicoccales bacterium]
MKIWIFLGCAAGNIFYNAGALAQNAQNQPKKIPFVEKKQEISAPKYFSFLGPMAAVFRYFFFLRNNVSFPEKVLVPQTENPSSDVLPEQPPPEQPPLPSLPPPAPALPPSPSLTSQENFPTQQNTSQLRYEEEIKEIFHKHKSFAEKHQDVIFAGAPHLSYRCYDYANQEINLKNYEKNYFKAILDLKYDLDVAENQCDWTAKEIIARELLEIIGGKYGTVGLNPADPYSSDPEMRKIVNFQNMAALHGAMAMLLMAIQRKTTEICKKNLKNLKKQEEENLRRLYIGEDLSLDAAFANDLKTIEIDLHEKIFEMNVPKLTYAHHYIDDIIELAKVLSNPILLEEFIVMLTKEIHQNWHGFFEGNFQQDKSLYLKTVAMFVEKNFDFQDKEFLKSMVLNFFEEIYHKVERLSKYRNNEINLKLRDCNGRDIFGNRDVCTYNSSLELVRQEQANESFVAFGGMFDCSKIDDIVNASNDKAKILLFIPYNHFDEHGQYIHSREYYNEELRKNKQMLANLSDQINKCKGDIDEFLKDAQNATTQTKKLLKIITTNKNKFFIPAKQKNEFDRLTRQFDNLVYQINQLKETHEAELKDIMPMIINLFPTNDLSSKVRTQVAYLVEVIHLNQWMADSPFLLKSSKKKIAIKRDIEDKLMYQFTYSWRVNDRPIFTASENLTPLKLLFAGKDGDKMRFILGALGLSLAYFASEDKTQTLQWPTKKFFNEISGKLNEEAFIDLKLQCFYITNPFAAIVGQAGLNNHARLILHYRHSQ